LAAGPDVGGGAEPYRQSERASIYKEQVDRLVAEGRAYPCFCTDEELEAMKAEAEAKKLPPIYRCGGVGAYVCAVLCGGKAFHLG
jgi:glutamyl-tRNA synthetase